MVDRGSLGTGPLRIVFWDLRQSSKIELVRRTTAVDSRDRDWVFQSTVVVDRPSTARHCSESLQA